MATFAADAGLAALSRRAHDILTQGRVKQLGLQPPAAQRVMQPPPNLRPFQYGNPNVGGRAAALAALRARFDPSALKINPFGARSRGEVQGLAQAAAMRQKQDLAGLGANDRFSSEEILRAANNPANAGIWRAHQVMQEGVHTDPDGRRYVMIKYVRPGVGGDTRKVYLP